MTEQPRDNWELSTGSLWRLLGYDELVMELSSDFLREAQTCLIQGPPGVGKTWIARAVGQLWDRNGGSTVVTVGDRLRSDIDLLPFEVAINEISNDWATPEHLKSSVANLLVDVKGPIGTIVRGADSIARSNRRWRTRKISLFEEREQQVAFQLERMARKRPLLIIADNLNSWDIRSLQLLNELLKPTTQAENLFLRDMRLLCVQTTAPFQPIAHPPHHSAIVRKTKRTENLRRVDSTTYPQVLECLGAEAEFIDSLAEEIYALTGGHLALSRALVEWARAEKPLMSLRQVGTQGVLKSLVAERMSALNESSDRALDLLKIAAVLGLAFSRKELICSSSLDESETSKLLDYALDDNILTSSSKYCAFSHDLFRDHFFEVGTPDHRAFRRRRAECLRSLRPASYAERALNALEAGLFDEAGVLAIQSALQEVRSGRDWNKLPRLVVELLQGSTVRPTVEALIEAYWALDSYQFESCYEWLSVVGYELGEVVRAEADYIRAMCLMTTRSEADREQGRQLLLGWQDLIDTEAELGTRVIRLLIYGYSHFRDKSIALDFESTLQRRLIARADYDEASLDELYALDRCSGTLNTSDIALKRSLRAVVYSEPPKGQVLPRRPAEYYRCLSNVVAKLVSNARYSEAVEHAQQLEEYIARFAGDAFPRTDFALMNCNLARYRAGAITAAEAANVQEAIHRSAVQYRDPFYSANALSVMRCLAGHSGDSSSILTDAYNTLLKERIKPEPSMQLLLRSNAIAIDYVSGRDPELCRHEWQELEPIVESIPYMIQPMLALRHTILAELMECGLPLSPVEFDEYPTKHSKPPDGPMWDNFGRGFRLPEIEFWRDN